MLRRVVVAILLALASPTLAQAQGSWPDPLGAHHEYSIGQIKEYLRLFLYRFFQLSQYKRSCIPNAPKVGSGGSLSPRGDWRAPSDAEAAVWLSAVEEVPDHD